MDHFPLPQTDVIIDRTAGHEIKSHLDGYAGYNQIQLAPEDQEKTTLRTPFGFSTVMPFGLKQEQHTTGNAKDFQRDFADKDGGVCR